MLPDSIVQSTNINTDTQQESSSPLNLLVCKCPRCRKGNMFNDANPWHLKNTLKMNKTCPVCNQPLDIEPGFYFGAGYVSYALTVAISAVTFVLWWKLIGFANENMLLYWLIANAVFMLSLQPYLMRISRTGWLAFFVGYDKNWRTNPPKKLERVNKEQENNW